MLCFLIAFSFAVSLRRKRKTGGKGNQETMMMMMMQRSWSASRNCQSSPVMKMKRRKRVCHKLGLCLYVTHHTTYLTSWLIFIFAVVAPVKGGKKTKVSCFDKLCGASVHWDALCGPNHFPPAA